jgi:hypothetical protein
MTVCDRMLRGKYGKLLRRGRIPYADITAIERFHGIRFTEQQIVMALDGRPDRLIVPPDHQEVA